MFEYAIALVVIFTKFRYLYDYAKYTTSISDTFDSTAREEW